MQDVVDLAEVILLVIQSIGVLVLIGGSLFVTGRAIFVNHRLPGYARVRQYRKELGAVFLIAIDFLTAGLAILTTMVTPNLTAIFALGLMVLIRAFLSVMLTLESEGRWPWQPHQEQQVVNGEPHRPDVHLPPKLPLLADDAPAEASSSDN